MIGSWKAWLLELQPLLGPRLQVQAIDLERPTEDEVRMTVTLDSSAEKPILMIEEGDSLTEVAAASCSPEPPRSGLADGFREIIDGVSV